MSSSAPRFPAGTQVVVDAEIRGSNGDVVHPHGAVGVITRTPAGSETVYHVRFPDGFESGFTDSALEPLKTFKNRLGATSRPGADRPDGDDFQLEDHVIYRCVTGSRAYGLETETSDTDLRGVYLAPRRPTVVPLWRPRTIRGQRRPGLPLGASEIHRPRAQGQSEHPRVPLLAARRKAHAHR